jgi:hypothetical protein
MSLVAPKTVLVVAGYEWIYVSPSTIVSARPQTLSLGSDLALTHSSRQSLSELIGGARDKDRAVMKDNRRL